MVHTRGQPRFADGDRVLCYEPDTTKAQVLYEAKVLEVVERRDRNGRRSMECLVHFQGWNSSWDRYVVEDQILEYSEANRKLQRALAEKFLPPGVIDRRRYSAADSQRSSSVGAASAAASEPDSGDEPEPEAPPSAVHIELPAPLRRRLDDDYHYVNKYHKLLPLPCPTTVVGVLEAYVHHWQQTGRRHPSHTARSKAKDMWWEAAVRSVNLCKEAVDGLRITFDHVVGSQLLYAGEREQHGRWLAPEGSAPEERTRHASARSDRTDESASRMTLRSRRHPRHDSESADCAASSDDEQPDCKRRLLSSESGTTDRAAWSLLPPSELNRNPPLPCCVYGPTHLLRLLALLPEILLHMHMSERKLNLVVHHVTLLLAFLQENAEQLFPKSRYR